MTTTGPNARIAAGSTEPIRSRITVSRAGAQYDPTHDPVFVLFQAPGLASPAAGDAGWKSAGWETVRGPIVDGQQQQQFYVLADVGPGGVATLARGTWIMWAKIVDNPDVPILECGPLVIF